MSRILYFDCFNGASGDMVLGALLDAGLPLEELRRALGSLAIDGAAVSATRVLRAGVSATKFIVDEHGHEHHHEHATMHTITDTRTRHSTRMHTRPRPSRISILIAALRKSTS